MKHNVIQFPRKDKDQDKLLASLKDAFISWAKSARQEINQSQINETIGWWVEGKLPDEFRNALNSHIPGHTYSNYLVVDYSWADEEYYNLDLSYCVKLVKAAFPAFQEKLEGLGVRVLEGDTVEVQTNAYSPLYLIDMRDLKRAVRRELE